MSSLLDILHRRDAAEPDAADGGPPSAGDAAPAIELHLAIDNGPATPPGDGIVSGGIGVQGLATALPESTAPDVSTDPYAQLARSFAEADGAGEPLPAATLRRRARRGTLWLAAGLTLIVLAAGVATWLLRPVDDSVVLGTLPPATDPVTDPGTGVEASGQPVAAPIARPPSTDQADRASPNRRQPDSPTSAAATGTPDPDWYDTPAIEDLAHGEGSNSGDAADAIRITQGVTTNPLYPRLKEAWTAFQAADFARAETLYREVHQADPGNTDALLGLAALAVRNGHNDEAIGLYRDVLRVEPGNASALGALSTLPGSATGMQSLDESTLKNLLRDQPSAANLHFALGLRYVADQRWPDAQQAFFDAVRNDPTNADYAYNLAVSLDELGQRDAAAGWYRKALALATGSTLFNPELTRARLAQLKQAGS